MRIGDYELHPACVLLPALAPDEFAELRDSIAAVGQLEPISRWARDGSILDGRNRLMACLELDVAPRIETVDIDNPWDWVWARNIKRRHLEPGRRAALRLEFDAGMRALIDAATRAAATRKTRGLKRGQQRPEPDRDGLENLRPLQEVPFPHDDPVVAALPSRAEPEDTARQILATAAGVSKKTAGKALKVREQRPDLHTRVCSGELTLEQADRERRRGVTEDEWREHEAYYTPAWPVELLVGSGFLGRAKFAVEPCVGDGAIVRALGPMVHTWFTMDIREVEPAHKGAHRTGSWLDAAAHLSKRERRELAKADLVITNSAFSDSQAVVETSWELCPRAHIWILQRRTWHDQARAEWFADHQPDELNISPRVRFRWPNGNLVGNGTDNAIHTWFGFAPGEAQPCAGPNGGISRTLMWVGTETNDE